VPHEINPTTEVTDLMNDLNEYARVHIAGLKHDMPHTAFLTPPGGVWVFLDAQGIRVKAATSKTVADSGGPEQFLKTSWPAAELEFPPFEENWTTKRVIEAVESSNLSGK
jgi:hypothetical protein